MQPCCDYIRSLKRHPRSIAPPRGFHSVISTTEIMVRDASCAQCYLPSPFLVYRNVSDSTPDRYSGTQLGLGVYNDTPALAALTLIFGQQSQKAFLPAILLPWLWLC